MARLARSLDGPLLPVQRIKVGDRFSSSLNGRPFGDVLHFFCQESEKPIFGVSLGELYTFFFYQVIQKEVLKLRQHVFLQGQKMLVSQ